MDPHSARTKVWSDRCYFIRIQKQLLRYIGVALGSLRKCNCVELVMRNAFFFGIGMLMLTSLGTGCVFAPVTERVAHELRPMSSCDGQPDGAIRECSEAAKVMGDTQCATAEQTCQGGVWKGPSIFDFCDSDTKSCDGIPHGSTQSGFLDPSPPSGGTCVSTTSTCVNGNWSGPMLYPSCSDLK